MHIKDRHWSTDLLSKLTCQAQCKKDRNAGKVNRPKPGVQVDLSCTAASNRKKSLLIYMAFPRLNMGMLHCKRTRMDAQIFLQWIVCPWFNRARLKCLWEHFSFFSEKRGTGKNTKRLWSPRTLQMYYIFFYFLYVVQFDSFEEIEHFRYIDFRTSSYFHFLLTNSV